MDKSCSLVGAQRAPLPGLWFFPKLQVIAQTLLLPPARAQGAPGGYEASPQMPAQGSCAPAGALVNKRTSKGAQSQQGDSILVPTADT